jgi:hypothetical protein
MNSVYEPSTGSSRANGFVIVSRDAFTNTTGLFIGLGAPTISVRPEVTFRKLADEWKSETGHLSFISQRVRHPAYRKILSLGESAVPFILKELEAEPNHWFHALFQLTGENPIGPKFSGTVTDAAKIWVEWGKDKYATEGD